MNCNQCSELLVDYSRDELPAADKAAVAKHLPGCSSCSAELTSLQQMFQLLDGSEQPSAKLQQNFEQRLAAEIARQAPLAQPNIEPRSGLFASLWPSRPFGALCYSFVLVACGVVSGQLLPPATLGFGSEYVVQGNTRQPQSCSVPSINEVL